MDLKLHDIQTVLYLISQTEHHDSWRSQLKCEISMTMHNTSNIL